MPKLFSHNNLNTKSHYKSAFVYLWKFIKPHKKWYIIASTISLVLVLTGLMQARITQTLIDSSIDSEYTEIIYSFVLFVVLICTNITLNFTSGVCVAKLSANASMDLKRHICNILLNAKYGELIKLKSGDTISTVNTDTTAVSDFIGGDLIVLFSQFTMAIGAIAYLLFISPLLALVTFVYTPIGMFFTLSLNRKMNKLYPLRADSEGEALSVVEQVLSQIPVIKSFVMEKQVKKKIYIHYDKVYNTEMKISIWDALMQPACSSTSSIPRIIYLIFAGYMVMNGDLTIGSFIAIFELISYIIGPSVYFPFMLNGLNRTIASINRINRLEAIPQAVSIKELATSTIPQININNICFGYSEDKVILQNFSLHHNGSGIITICGTSGTGKTTLLDLISGLYSPVTGTIETQGDISVVTQESYLFDETLLENVRLAKEDATDEEVILALKLAGADKFAKELPNGYNTMLGDSNIDLSGGQKQRISLARTILMDNSIWLLDEPTSALDPQTEKIIIDVIKNMSKKKLILISAHRQSLIGIADRVINLNDFALMEGAKTL